MIGKKLFWLTIFAIAFGFVESSVVVYLRRIYYGAQTSLFPLKIFEPGIFTVELFREAATLIMLYAVAAAAFEKKLLRFAGFIWGFAVWDIMYYVFLKLSINWPATILDWDILFLIPIAWASPVLAPVVCSLTMMLLAGIIFFYSEKNYAVKLSRLQIIFLIIGSLVILISFLQDYATLFLNTPKESVQEAVVHYVPRDFNWLLFFAGEALILFAVWDLMKGLNKKA
ncbi:MAG TPA: hypothetical protein VI757_04485 [Bacteroidia bacterium]|nr:hypothetical protein [Bacteroidia bacterium]